jgi:putative CocE/NonD family hydrolase
LICASYSDQGLHTRGSFEAFRRIGSADRFLYTHRGGKWSVYYAAECLALQARFFDCFLKGEENGMRGAAPVRIEVRARAGEVHAVRAERTWPIAGTRWTKLFLAPGELREKPFDAGTTQRFDVPTGSASFALRVADDMEIAGPMKLRLHVELAGASDAYLFAAVRKMEASTGREVLFEGPFGFGCDVVSKGWLRLAHRRVDEARSEPHRPFHPSDRAEPVAPGEIVPADIELLPSATFFRRGDVLRLDVQGQWFWRRSMLLGMFPGNYAPSPAATVVLHLGGAYDAHLLVPRTDEGA